MHGAGVGNVFQLLHLIRRQLRGHVKMNSQSRDAADRGLGHMFFHGDAGASKIDIHRTRGNTHDGEDAGAESGGDKVGGGEAFAFAVVVFGGVGVKAGAGGAVNGLAPEVAEIGGFDFNHIAGKE